MNKYSCPHCFESFTRKGNRDRHIISRCKIIKLNNTSISDSAGYTSSTSSKTLKFSAINIFDSSSSGGGTGISVGGSGSGSGSGCGCGTGTGTGTGTIKGNITIRGKGHIKEKGNIIINSGTGMNTGSGMSSGSGSGTVLTNNGTIDITNGLIGGSNGNGNAICVTSIINNGTININNINIVCNLVTEDNLFGILTNKLGSNLHATNFLTKCLANNRYPEIVKKAFFEGLEKVQYPIAWNGKEFRYLDDTGKVVRAEPATVSGKLMNNISNACLMANGYIIESSIHAGKTDQIFDIYDVGSLQDNVRKIQSSKFTKDLETELKNSCFCCHHPYFLDDALLKTFEVYKPDKESPENILRSIRHN